MAILAKSQITLTTVSDGEGISISIEGGVRGIGYAADGTNPNPSTSSSFSVVVSKGKKEIAPVSYSWSCGGNLSGSSTEPTFTPRISSIYATGSSYVQVTIVPEQGAAASSQTVPIVSTKNADGLDWIADWNSNKTTISDKSVISPRIFAGENTGTTNAPVLNGVALGMDVLTGSSTTIGLVGYNKNNPVFKLDTDGTFLVSPDGDAGGVVTGSSSGLYYDGQKLSIAGKVKIMSGSTIGASDQDVDTVISDIGEAKSMASSAESLAESSKSAALEALDKIDDLTLEVDGNVFINGDLITNGTITGNMIKAGSFVIRNEEMDRDTFVVNENGDVKVNGTFESDAYDPLRNTGYKITPDGNAVFNQAVIRGDVILPNAGMTNYGAPMGNENLATNSALVIRDTWKNASNDTFGSYKVYKPTNADTSTKLSISYDIEYSNLVKSQSDGDIYLQGSGDVTSWNSGAWNGGPRLGGSITWGEGKSGSFNVKYQFTLSADQIKNSYWGVGFRANYIQSGLIKIKNFKVETGSVYTPWCPHPSEQANYTRVWAGEDFEKRDSAPFRVSQDGSLYALDGTFNGKLYGQLDAGQVHIHQDTIEINQKQTFYDPIGMLVEKEPLGGNTDGYIKFSPSQSNINTNLILGSLSSPSLSYSNANKTIDISKTNISAVGGTTELTIDTGTTWNTGGMTLKAIESSNGGEFTWNFRGTKDNEFTHTGTMWGVSKGAKGQSYGDMCLRRLTWDDSFNLYVRGNVKIKESFSSDNHNIEMRSVANEGWGFYAT